MYLLTCEKSLKKLGTAGNLVSFKTSIKINW